MAPFASLKALDPNGVKGIFFDIDETLSTGGKITPEAFASLWALHKAGLVVVPVTGRSAGWCDHIARMWPVSAVIGENGAFYFRWNGKKICKTTLAQKHDLTPIAREILRKIPGSALASDQAYREFDLAIDYCEDVYPLSAQAVDKIVAIFRKHACRAKISSIHVNGWKGEYDKLTAAARFVKEVLGLDLKKENGAFVFCGDSPNDEPMFGFFDKSVGVANVLDFKNRLKTFPKYVTTRKAGEGFAELACHLVL